MPASTMTVGKYHEVWQTVKIVYDVRQICHGLATTISGYGEVVGWVRIIHHVALDLPTREGVQSGLLVRSKQGCNTYSEGILSSQSTFCFLKDAIIIAFDALATASSSMCNFCCMPYSSICISVGCGGSGVGGSVSCCSDCATGSSSRRKRDNGEGRSKARTHMIAKVQMRSVLRRLERGRRYRGSSTESKESGVGRCSPSCEYFLSSVLGR